MKETVRISIERIISFLTHILTKFESNQGSEENLNTLAPTENAKNVETYLQSLDWALKNKTKIKNIAISGPYGSGKSSVLKTFINKNKNTSFKFLNISLATFKESKYQPNVPQNGENNILRLIELSVLQQLFYHEKDAEIPDSRFKKIKSHKTRFLFYYSIGLIALLISVLHLISPDFLSKFSLFQIPKNLISLFHYLAASITLVGLFLIVFKSSRVLKSLAIKKLNISNAEIEVDSGISKSILNNHIDEILYFFEVTDYNIVIIEDLDRFEQTEVFTKLREINLLINNSKKIDKEVVFIYAIKDDMFIDKDRTKFFDLIIPIIPIINSSNSNEKLLEIVKKNEYKISIDLIDNISLFIDDMRLLYNIMNEYYIYYKNLDAKLDQEKLLSMVVYKNIYPKDFTKLSESQGNLYETISNKSTYLKEQILVLDEEVKEIKNLIIEAEKAQFSDIKELRLVYINKIIEQVLISQSQPFKQFWIDDKAYSISSLTEENNFSKLISGNVQYQYDSYSSYKQNCNFNFETIENQVNPELTYNERENRVLNNARLDRLKKQISELENKKITIRKSKLSNLISDNHITINQEFDKQGELINILLRNSYIDENYLDYISIFYEGSLSKADYQFLINVKIQKHSEFDYKLNKTARLIEKINLFDFEKEYILNNDLVEYLQKQNNKFPKKIRLFKQLSNQTTNSIKFIDSFIGVTTNLEIFIQNLCHSWKSIWTFIETDSLFDDDKKNRYLTLIIEYAKTEDIRSIFSQHKDFLNKRADFLKIIDNEKKIKKIIEILSLKFQRISSDSPISLIEYVYKGNYYQLNKVVVELLLKHYKKFDADIFSTANYTSIMSSSLELLIDYVNNNLNDYINSIYLKITSNIDEPIESYLELVNSEVLDEGVLDKLISHVRTKITDINTISARTHWKIFFKKSQVVANWENVLAFFENEENIFSKELIDFLNAITNAEQLSAIKMQTEVNGENIFSNLCSSIIKQGKLSDSSYKLIIKSIPWWYGDLELSNISKNKVGFLIENRVIKPTINSYNELKENHEGLNIVLLEMHPKVYIEKINEFELDSFDLNLILRSSKLSLAEKAIFYDNCTEDTIHSDNQILIQLSEFLIKQVVFKIESVTKRKILLSVVIPKIKRIIIFNQIYSTLDNDFIESFIETLGVEYYDIVDYRKKATLIDNSLNRQFLNNLVSIKFLSSFSETKKGLRVNHKRR